MVPTGAKETMLLISMAVILYLAIIDNEPYFRAEQQPLDMDVAKIAANLVMKWPSKEQLAMGLAAQELSHISPVLQRNGVRLVGIGLEELGVEEFVEKKFWAGELYIDQKKEAYNALGFKRFSIFSLPGMLLSKIARTNTAKARERGLGGDLKGDGFQNGGLVVVGKGGRVLYSFVQENVADHASNEDILKALNLSPDEAAAATTWTATATCTDEACSLDPPPTTPPSGQSKTD